MKKFKFALQKVLDFRDRICDEKRQELGRANSFLANARQHLATLRASAAGLSLESGGTDPANSSLSAPIMSVNDLMLVGDYARRLKAEIEKQLIVVANAEETAEKAREEYVNASKDSKALQSLKDKRKIDYDELTAKEEEKNMDELTVQRFSRK